MTNTGFSDAEIERYARHIVLPDIGGAGQQKIKQAAVLVVGAGGLGAPVLLYLAAAGIGRLGIVDDERVSLSNLQRQILYRTTDINHFKTKSAAKALSRLNPYPKLNVHTARLTAANAASLICNYDIVVDGCDNFDTRFLLAEMCEKYEKILVSGAVSRLDGSLTTLKPFGVDQKGRPNPRFQDLFPDKPGAEKFPPCEEAGILGMVTGVIGTLQALEVIKALASFGELMIGRHLLFDARDMRFQTVFYHRNKG